MKWANCFLLSTAWLPAAGSPGENGRIHPFPGTGEPRIAQGAGRGDPLGEISLHRPLAAGVAHEVGNPTGAILGYLDLLAKGGLPEGERERCSSERKTKRGASGESSANFWIRASHPRGRGGGGCKRRNRKRPFAPLSPEKGPGKGAGD